MYVCTYQQIQDMMSLQSDCAAVTHQEEYDCAILYYKENNNDMCTDSFCIHVQLRNIVSLMYMYLKYLSCVAILLRVFYT